MFLWAMYAPGIFAANSNTPARPAVTYAHENRLPRGPALRYQGRLRDPRADAPVRARRPQPEPRRGRGRAGARDTASPPPVLRGDLSHRGGPRADDPGRREVLGRARRYDPHPARHAAPHPQYRNRTAAYSLQLRAALLARRHRVAGVNVA